MTNNEQKRTPDPDEVLEQHQLEPDSSQLGETIYDTLEIYGQTPDSLIYWNDPTFQDLLVRFQNAEWDKCLEYIDQFQIPYPDDKFLVIFRRDIEVRKRLQNVRKQRLEAEKRDRFRKTARRVYGILLVAILVFLATVWVNNAYQARVAQARLDYEATLLAQTLATDYQNAESFMKAGKPQDALNLYLEIQRLDPTYNDVSAKIQEARDAIALEDLYQQGIQAVQAGKIDEALTALRQVETLRPKYKDTLSLIHDLETDKQVAALVQKIYTAYAAEDWAGVVDASESIREIRPFFEDDELKEILFVSYQNMVVDIAGRDDATLADIEKAERYYRFALALFPQDKSFVVERSQLQDVAIELLASKYYLYGINLLQSSNYSYTGVKESIRILNKANGIGSGSPAIQSEIEKAQLFLDGYDALLNRDWTGSIEKFEELDRKEPGYAEGRLQYLLYEAYTAHGDALFTYADFEGASRDYQEAERISWRDEGNILRLFQIEIRIAATLQKLWRTDEAVEFYRYAFDRLGYKSRFTSAEDAAILDALNKANQAYLSGDAWEAVRYYENALADKAKFYEYQTVSATRGETLFNIAFKYRCTVELLRTINNLGESMIFSKDQEILVPANAQNP